ncbi:MAG: cytochrome c3 family protein [Bryobacteraceae bacterium]
MTKLLALAALIAFPLAAASSTQAIIGSQHDLSVTGGGPVKSGVGDACIFCHGSHNVSTSITPLWNHALSAQTYTGYTSTTYNAGAQTPASGSSKLCLSCHDGTVAVGQTLAKGLISTTGSMSGSDVFGASLASSHPVGMAPVDDGQLVSTLFSNPPSTRDSSVKLVGGKIECVTCHDPHVQNNDPAVPMFLARSNSGGALCTACHDASRAQPNQMNGWTTAAHAVSTNTAPTTAGFGAYGTVSANGCSNCHLAHNNPVAPRNMRAAEEAACSACHSGANMSPSISNVMAEFTKTYAHPTTTVTGAHDPTESLPVNNTRHAECADCHNSHAAQAQTGTPTAPNVQAALLGVNGYDTSGAQTPAAYEYQICLKCHGDSTNKPASSVYGRTPPRYSQGPLPATYAPPPPTPPDPLNIRLKFMSPISHNVMGYSVPSTPNRYLRPFMLNLDGTNNTNRPMTSTSRIFCTDCHDNNQARSSKGTGPNGAHGSAYQHLLQWFLYQEPSGGASGGANVANNYALCNKCHVVEGNNSVYSNAMHKNHMDKGTSCSSCHDPHGVIGGTATTSRAMINVDTAVARPAGGNFGYFTTTAGRGGCYMICHGQDHTPKTY